MILTSFNTTGAAYEVRVMPRRLRSNENIDESCLEIFLVNILASAIWFATLLIESPATDPILIFLFSGNSPSEYRELPISIRPVSQSAFMSAI